MSAKLAALERHGVRFIIVGLSAAVLQGANSSTRDIDIWFEDVSDPEIGRAVHEAKGICDERSEEPETLVADVQRANLAKRRLVLVPPGTRRREARVARGNWVSGSFGMRPPQIGGDEVGDRLDVVTHMHGLGRFSEELEHTTTMTVDGLPLRVLNLDRIVASKRAAGRPKDLAAIPALEEALAALEESRD